MRYLGLQVRMGLFSATLSALVGMAFEMNLDTAYQHVRQVGVVIAGHIIVFLKLLSLYSVAMVIICCYGDCVFCCGWYNWLLFTQIPGVFWIVFGIMLTSCGLLWRKVFGFLKPPR